MGGGVGGQLPRRGPAHKRGHSPGVPTAPSSSPQPSKVPQQLGTDRGPTAALGLGSCTQGPVCRAGSWRRMGEDGALSCSATTLPGLSGSTGLQLFVGQITPYASTNKNKKFLYVFGEATGFCHASILPFIKESKVLFKLYNSTIKIQCCFHYPNL